MNLELWSSLEFFWPQILLGSSFGILLSLIGALLVLRRQIFFGITLSQGVSLAVAISLYFGYDSPLFVPLLSLLILLPLVVFKKSRNKDDEAFLATLFLAFTALSQFLLNLGGNVTNHLMAAYFGDILTSPVSWDMQFFIPFLFALFAYSVLHNRFLSYSFDQDFSIVRGNNPIQLELMYFGLLIIFLSFSIHMFGSYFSMSQLVIPCFALLPWARSIKILYVGTGLISFLATILGFLLSFQSFPWGQEELHLPTTSTIILLLCFFALLSRMLYRSLGR